MSDPKRAATRRDPGRAPATWETLARAAARGERASQAPEMLRELLLVSLADDPYALPVERVREIVRLRPITPLPRVPREICGVISLRGEILQVVDLRRRLALSDAAPDRRTRIVVVHAEDGQAAGLLVDGVHQVLRAPEAALRPPTPSEAGTVAALCLTGEKFVSLLDVDRVLDLAGPA